MCQQHALDFALEYPQAASAVGKSFYVDNNLTGADSVEEAVQLQTQLQELFSKGGFLLRKWNSSDTAILDHIHPKLRDIQPDYKIPESEGYSMTLGIQLNSSLDHFRLTIANFPDPDNFTKRQLRVQYWHLMAYLAGSLINHQDKPTTACLGTQDRLGWISTSRNQGDIVAVEVQAPSLSERHIPRCYFDVRRETTFLMHLKKHTLVPFMYACWILCTPLSSCKRPRSHLSNDWPSLVWSSAEPICCYNIFVTFSQLSVYRLAAYLPGLTIWSFWVDSAEILVDSKRMSIIKSHTQLNR